MQFTDSSFCSTWRLKKDIELIQKHVGSVKVGDGWNSQMKPVAPVSTGQTKSFSPALCKANNVCIRNTVYIYEIATTKALGNRFITVRAGHDERHKDSFGLK